MRRGLVIVVLVSIAGAMTPSTFAQYPPPGYGPMPVQYLPQPAYGPPPMMMPPAPMQNRPAVLVYGPLTPLEVAPASFQKPGVDPSKSVTTAQGASAPAGSVQPVLHRRHVPAHHEACGPLGCDDDFAPHTPFSVHPPRHGFGHFIGDVGAYFLVPHMSSRAAYNTTTNLGTFDSKFPQNVDFGPRISLGYLFHSEWGFRANYWYLRGSVNQDNSHNALNTSVATPTAAPFQLSSPSQSIQQGIGVDGFTFTQRLDINVADVEILKEHQWHCTTFLWNVGARYARILQGYTASRENLGGTNGVNTVTLDRQDLNTSSVFDGMGPTVGLELVHRLGASNLSVYGNMRASWLWGVNRFTEELNSQRNSVDAGVPTTGQTALARFTQDNRVVTIAEAELGLQYGVNCGRCYVYGRMGGVYQRWLDVGSPVTPDGNLTFLGGTARIGVTY